MAPHPLAFQRCPRPVQALSTVPLPIGYPAFRKAGDSICTRLSRKYSAVRATSPLHPIPPQNLLALRDDPLDLPLPHVLNPAVRLFPERLPPQGPQMLHRRIPVHHPHPLRTLHLGKPLTPGCPVPDDHCSTPRQPLSPSPAAPQRPPPPVPPRGSSTPEPAPLTPSARISDAPSPIEATPLQNVPSRPRLSLPLPPP
jgi:hypothetical protein